ncbi:MAG: aminotransferase, partial [Leptospiraceae bacterium]|nr:aminotransferase [Leptospiraceae bacterium]
NDPIFQRYIKSLLDAKMLEVCSTTLPQLAIPKIYSSKEFIPHLKRRNEIYKQRAEKAVAILSGVKGVKVIEPKGAFYLTVYFEQGTLNSSMSLSISNRNAFEYINSIIQGSANDRRFVLNLLASTGICVVPLSSFCCKKDGFRITLLEEDSKKFDWIFNTVRKSIEEYLQSA